MSSDEYYTIVDETTTQVTYSTNYYALSKFIVPHIIYGSILTFSSIFILILAILVIFAIYRSGSLQKSPIFVLTTWSLVDSVLMLFMFAFYIGPTIIFRLYWPDKKGFGDFNHQVGEILQAIILAGSIFQTVIAINRVLAFRNAETILSISVYNVIGLSVLLLGFLLSYLQAYGMICCKTYFNQDIYGLSRITIVEFSNDTYWNIEEYFDYGRTYINLPVHIIATIIPIICYAYIFGSTFYIRHTMVTHVSSKQTMEIVRSIQFAAIFFFYACYWIYETIIHYYITADVHMYAFITLFLLLEATMNTVINATGQEVRPMIKKTLKDIIMLRQTKVIIISRHFTNTSNITTR